MYVKLLSKGIQVGIPAGQGIQAHGAVVILPEEAAEGPGQQNITVWIAEFIALIADKLQLQLKSSEVANF